MGRRGNELYYLCDPEWPTLNPNEVYEMFIESFVIKTDVVALFIVVYAIMLGLTLFNYCYRFKVKPTSIAPGVLAPMTTQQERTASTVTVVNPQIEERKVDIYTIDVPIIAESKPS